MSVLAIVGMGALGKTTLAQLVYNDPRVCQSFDLCAWVCVSEYFDVNNITRKIVSSVTQNNCDHIQFGELQGALVNQIKEKKVFLVLDDVWNERSDYWELLCMPLLASRCCKIIVTTRNEAVARLVQTMPFYNLNCLSSDESWSLFKQTAFVQQENVTPASLTEIGKSIVKKCKGLPLAIKTLGSILRFEADEMKWTDVLKSELWDLEQSQNEILPALKLSYNHMPIYLKRCFVALSLFPKYCYLDENRVVWLWKLLHLLQLDGSDNGDKIGNLYFSELVQRSLLQNYPHGDGKSVMHDLVHDLACFVAGEEFFRLEADKPVEIPQNARYISIVPNYEKCVQISNASHSLRAIITTGYDTYFENPEALFLNCKKLRTLHVEQRSLAKALLDFIGSMRLLRHFELGGCEGAELVIPDSVFQLFNLRTLEFEVHVPHGIGRLINLHTLPQIHLTRCGCCFNIRDLRNMNRLRELYIYGLRDVSGVEDANEAHLHHKKNLEILQLSFNTWRSCQHAQRAGAEQSINTVSGGQLLESLRPHHQSLRVLRIEKFNCERYPSWLGSVSFSKLTELKLAGFRCRNLPTLGELPSLKFLEIASMDLVEHIGREFCSLDPRVKGFRTLVRLRFEDLYRLSEWSGVEDGEFSRLESLCIWSVSELRSLPLVPFSSLQSFTLYDCTNLATFPASATLRELTISNCASLTELASLPSLRSLELLNCPSLVTLGHLPSLADLSIDGPLEDEVVYRLLNSHPSLKCLSVSSPTMTSIPLEPQNLPSLTKLTLFCPNVQYCDALADLGSLRLLNVWHSPQLYVPDSLRRQLEELHACD